MERARKLLVRNGMCKTWIFTIEKIRKKGNHKMGRIELNNKTTLVTDAFGFIGANLVRRLYKDVNNVTIIGINNINDYYNFLLGLLKAILQIRSWSIKL